MLHPVLSFYTFQIRLIGYGLKGLVCFAFYPELGVVYNYIPGV